MPTMPEVDPYREMEKEARSRTYDNVAREIRNLKEDFKSIQVHKGVEGVLVVVRIRRSLKITSRKRLKNLFISVKCNMIWRIETEAPPYDAMPQDAFNNWTCLGAKLDEIVEPIQLPGKKYTFGLGYEPTPEEISSANLKRKKGLEEAVEDNLTEGLKNLFIEEAKCNMILEDCTEASTIWDAMPEDALNNWTCNPSPVFRESW
ncbi:hypothetical protein H5410_001193 [Solanum commersonii]|uniref:Uncharacterized protein n=1 Tax=Solanum commersonii TaxID=4109 RepID=A0A9J6AYF3_SOLCO|nr:hypothetical protein H5410_001193 [Solanum commersonii]